MEDIISKIKSKNVLDKNEIIAVLSDNSINAELFSAADDVRKANVGDAVHLRGLIEFSNFCKCSCKYCGIRCENKKIQRFRLDILRILDCAKKAVDCGYKTVVLQSGEDVFYDVEKMADIISGLKKLKLAVTLSLGEKSFEEYSAYRAAGADRYLLRIETTNRRLYEKMHPNMSFDNRLRCLNDIKKLGYEVGTGCLVGLPEQDISSLADDILFFKKIGADMVGIGPFIPHFDTPLSSADKGDFLLSLKVMALTRLLLPDINIPATTAMETIMQNGRLIALQTGANVVMPNIVDGEQKKQYEIYPNKFDVAKSVAEYRFELTEQLKSINRSISENFGFRQNKI